MNTIRYRDVASDLESSRLTTINASAPQVGHLPSSSWTEDCISGSPRRHDAPRGHLKPLDREMTEPSLASLPTIGVREPLNDDVGRSGRFAAPGRGRPGARRRPRRWGTCRRHPGTGPTTVGGAMLGAVGATLSHEHGGAIRCATSGSRPDGPPRDSATIEPGSLWPLPSEWRQSNMIWP